MRPWDRDKKKMFYPLPAEDDPRDADAAVGLGGKGVYVDSSKANDATRRKGCVFLVRTTPMTQTWLTDLTGLQGEPTHYTKLMPWSMSTGGKLTTYPWVL